MSWVAAAGTMLIGACAAIALPMLDFGGPRILAMRLVYLIINLVSPVNFTFAEMTWPMR